MHNEPRRRYARHLVLPEIGEAGQQKLLASRIAIIGCGGLGSVAAGYLAAMGIGHLTLIDPDRVELSNLQRQILFESRDIGTPKVEAAATRLEEINDTCAVTAREVRLTPDNAESLLKGADIVLDGSDNFDTRFAVNDACVKLRIPLVSAALIGFSGQISTFKAHLRAPHPCYRCLVSTHPDHERSCAQEGVLGALAGVMGSMQAVEAVKEILELGESLSGKLLIYDALSAKIRNVELMRDPACSTCCK